MSWQQDEAFGLLRRIGREILDAIYPRCCALCGVGIETGRHGFCSPCHQALTHDTAATCPRCAASVGPFAHDASGCADCRGETFAFSEIIRMGEYQGKLRDAILRMKNAAAEDLAVALAEAWAHGYGHRFMACCPAAILPMPLHWLRRWQRGYNAAGVLARQLSNRLRIPFRANVLFRVRPTARQAALPRHERRRNVANAFVARVGPELRGKAVWLVDDVLTTGATAHAAAGALRKAGVGSVYVAVLARRSWSAGSALATDPA